MRYYLVAGEASGDLHGSNLMRGLYRRDPEADIRFWGGGLMDADHVLNHSNWITITPNTIDRTDFVELKRLQGLQGTEL